MRAFASHLFYNLNAVLVTTLLFSCTYWNSTKRNYMFSTFQLIKKKKRCSFFLQSYLSTS